MLRTIKNKLKEVILMLTTITTLIGRIATALDTIAANTAPGGLSAADTQTIVTALTTLAVRAEAIANPPAPTA